MSSALAVELTELVAERWASLLALHAARDDAVDADPANIEAWQRVLLASDFAAETLRRQPHWLSRDGLAHIHANDDVRARVDAAVAGASSDAAFLAALRRVRHGESLRLIYRDVNALDDVAATLTGTTRLYEALLSAAVDRAAQSMLERHGHARDVAGEAQQIVVLAMGKMGGGELNFSSDIDLIFAYPENGSSDGPRPLENDEYFAKLGREIVRLLSAPGPDGIVARVDLRLRPFGQSGRLAFSFAAMEQYYQREGRDWERYAWIKARPVAGDIEAGERLIDMLRPFVYRRYLDYTAFAGLREMKALIDAEVARKDLADNLKLGHGGIREIEFCVQLVQLIRGGRDSGLRVHGLLPALAACEQRGLIDAHSASCLRDAYLFLRQIENRLQMFADQQTHSAPQDQRTRERIALASGHEHWAALQARIAQHRDAVSAEFASVVVPGGGRDELAADAVDPSVWRAAREGSLTAEALAEAGFVPGDAARDVLHALPRGAAVRGMSARSAERLDRLMPQLIADARASKAPLPCLRRLAALVQAIARRSAYLALLDEQPDARRRLAALFADSAFLAERVIAQPLLLDDVLDPRIEQLPLRQSQVAEELAQALETLDERHPEADLERLNETRSSLAFRLGLAFRDHRADAPATARRLAALAAASVSAVRSMARTELVRRHGDIAAGGGFAVLAYGSLGAAELGFSSDLDLVFLYDQAVAEQSSDGSRPLEGMRWFQRLAQRIVHWLTFQHRGGRLYEVDTRLRPDGSKGLLVTSLQGFAEYQRERAWTWEHQALVRARGIAGDPALLRDFDSVRAEVLSRVRDPQAVTRDVLDMRTRWRRERNRSNAESIDLKQGLGALLDLDFFLQGMVLLHASCEPSLLENRNTVHLIEAAQACGVFDADTAQTLTAAHANLLDHALRCTLDARPRVVPRDPALQHSLDAILTIARAHGFDFNQP